MNDTCTELPILMKVAIYIFFCSGFLSSLIVFICIVYVVRISWEMKNEKIPSGTFPTHLNRSE